ncbi:MAG: hypothetical protein DRJ47_08100, partial [Thermoprotei archaeon]
SGDDPLSLTCDWAVKQGVVVVVAAGNEGNDYFTITAPGSARRVITVGASDKYDDIAYFSSRGPTLDYRIKPDVVAPGVDIKSAYPSGYAYMDGTSMATPHVSGLAALILQAYPQLKPGEVKSLIASSARLLPRYMVLGSNTNYPQASMYYSVFEQGAGRVDAYSAISALLYLKPAIIDLGVTSGDTVIEKNMTLCFTPWTLNISSPLNITFSISVTSIMEPDKEFNSSFHLYCIVTLANGTQFQFSLPRALAVDLCMSPSITLVLEADLKGLPYHDYEGIIWVRNASNPSQVLAHAVFSVFKLHRVIITKISPEGEPLGYSWVDIVKNNTSNKDLIRWLWCITSETGKAEVYLPSGEYFFITVDIFDSTTYYVAKVVKIAEATTYITIDERDTYPIRLVKEPNMVLMEKGLYTIIPYYDSYWNKWYYYSIGVLFYYPASVVNYANTPFLTLVRYLYCDEDYINPSALDLIEAPTIYSAYEAFPRVSSGINTSMLYCLELMLSKPNNPAILAPQVLVYYYHRIVIVVPP